MFGMVESIMFHWMELILKEQDEAGSQELGSGARSRAAMEVQGLRPRHFFGIFNRMVKCNHTVFNGIKL